MAAFHQWCLQRIRRSDYDAAVRRSFTKKARPIAKTSLQSASGLHWPFRSQTYFFTDVRVDDEPATLIALGRARRCGVRLQDETVSMVHAIVERKLEGYYIFDRGSTNGTLINGENWDRPTLVTVGMEIHLGQVLLIGVDQEGRAPLRGFSLDSCRRDAVRIYGNACEAARRTKDGFSREFFRMGRSQGKRNAK
jgi:hypothetical protein